jgi:DNA-binding CsgD family transcriptional regulator
MIDEARIHARLESDLLAALTLAAEEMGQWTHAGLVAACVYDGPPQAPTCYVSASRLGLRAAEEASLRHWPEDSDGLFAHLRDHAERDRVFRVREMMDELTYARQRFFRRIEAYTPVRDAACLTASLAEGNGNNERNGDSSHDSKAWFALVLLRCGNQSPFPDATLTALGRFRPAIARVVARGLQREAQPRGFELQRHSGQLVHRPVSTAELLSKLSRTELNVLNFLRSEMTERRIAGEISRSPHTVHVHVKNIYRKLGVTSRKDLAALFTQQ